jgi:hypothetical protein
LAYEPTHHTLVALGVASFQGISVAAFERQDSDRLLFFCSQNKTKGQDEKSLLSAPPTWSAPLVRKRAQSGLDSEAGPSNKRMKFSSLRPIPHSQKQRMVPFVGVRETEMLHDLASTQTEVANPVPVKPEPVHVNPIRPRKPASTSLHAREIISLNSMPVKKHQCDRNPIRACSEVCTFSDELVHFILFLHLFPCTFLCSF